MIIIWDSNNINYEIILFFFYYRPFSSCLQSFIVFYLIVFVWPLIGSFVGIIFFLYKGQNQIFFPFHLIVCLSCFQCHILLYCHHAYFAPVSKLCRVFLQHGFRLFFKMIFKPNHFPKFFFLLLKEWEIRSIFQYSCEIEQSFYPVYLSQFKV